MPPQRRNARNEYGRLECPVKACYSTFWRADSLQQHVRRRNKEGDADHTTMYLSTRRGSPPEEQRAQIATDRQHRYYSENAPAIKEKKRLKYYEKKAETTLLNERRTGWGAHPETCQDHRVNPFFVLEECYSLGSAGRSRQQLDDLDIEQVVKSPGSTLSIQLTIKCSFSTTDSPLRAAELQQCSEHRQVGGANQCCNCTSGGAFSVDG